MALSLNPYHEDNDAAAMVEDDAFLFDTLSHWEFGATDTGDIMVRENIQKLWERAKELGRVTGSAIGLNNQCTG